jgi:phosphoribosylanthranilate isomerase
VRAVRPHTVDVASGVEVSGRPRQKDLGRVRAFVAAARSA